MDIEEIVTFVYVWVSATALLCFCHYSIAASVPKGALTLISLLPIFYFLAVLPLSLSAFQLVAPTAFLLAWLCNFKLLLFTFGSGPLSRSPSCLHFVLAAALPIDIKQDTLSAETPSTDKNGPVMSRSRAAAPASIPEKPGSSHNLHEMALLPAKLLLQAILLRACDYRSYLHPYLVWLLYGANTLFGVQLVMAIYAIPGWAILGRLGFELEPQFNQPLLTTSLEDFWGRRWNLTVSRILRLTVYNPSRSVCARIVGPELGSYAAVIATFAISGLMHEAMFYYVMRLAPTWEVTAFFLIQGVSVVSEKAAKKRCRGSWKLNRVVSGVLISGFIGLTAVWLLGVPLTRNGIDEKAIMECNVMINFLKEKAWLLSALVTESRP